MTDCNTAILAAIVAVGAAGCSAPEPEVELKRELAAVNAEGPAAVDEVTMRINVADDGSYVTYTMAVAKGVEVGDSAQLVANLKAYTKQEISANDVARAFMVLLDANGRGLRYTYTLADNAKTYVVTFAPDEVGEMASGGGK